MSPSILIVDDQKDVASAHQDLLQEIGYKSEIQSNPEKVETFLVKNPTINLVLLDIQMPKLNGLELLKRIRLKWPHIGVIMATVVNDIEAAVSATKAGAYNYILKPLGKERLGSILLSYFSNQPKYLIDDPRFAAFITNYQPFEEIFRRVKIFSEADVNVFIQGETGTGKEIFAQMLHALSKRHKENFVAVNVAALSPSLFEAELFGHKKGAFTGANFDRIGYLEQAGSGTLFLDEIGELNLEQQKKLLRVLQTQTYSRVGESEERKLNARVILATNKTLVDDEDTFRSDLYFRLSGHTIKLPPLRERLGDIELLSNYFLEKHCSQFGRSLNGFSPDAISMLKTYAFPGNVRELEGIISSAVLLEQSNVIQVETLPSHLMPECKEKESSEDLETLKYNSIMSALAKNDGNQTKAAKQLGIARGTLNRLLQEYRREKN
jgi:two-component system response regulator AtoC